MAWTCSPTDILAALQCSTHVVTLSAREEVHEDDLVGSFTEFLQVESLIAVPVCKAGVLTLDAAVAGYRAIFHDYIRQEAYYVRGDDYQIGSRVLIEASLTRGVEDDFSLLHFTRINAGMIV